MSSPTKQSDHNTDIMVLGQHVRDLRKAMTALEIQRTQMLLDKADRDEVVQLQKDLIDVRHELDRVYRSTSWRITAPIRKIMRIIRI